MKQHRCANWRALLAATAILVGVPIGVAQDLLQLSPSAHVTGIDIVEGTLSDQVTITVEFENNDSGGLGRQLVLTNNAPFPVSILSVGDGLAPDLNVWYELVTASGDVPADGGTLVLARNVYPNPIGSCGRVDQPPCTYDLVLTLELEMVMGGRLAAEGDYSLTFELKANSNPIELDFTTFFDCLDEFPLEDDEAAFLECLSDEGP